MSNRQTFLPVVIAIIVLLIVVLIIRHTDSNNSRIKNYSSDKYEYQSDLGVTSDKDVTIGSLED